MRTSDKVLLAVLVLLLVGMSGVFITAVSSKDAKGNSMDSESRLVMNDITTKQTEVENEEQDEEIDAPVTGSALERASAVALAYIGEGRVTDSEIGDEEGYYEIEITLDNGNEVDVHLDESFNVLSAEYEEDSDED